MPSGSPVVIVAVACLLLAAVAHARGWRAGVWLAAAGAVILAGALAARGLRAGFWPLTSEYEFALAFALGTTVAAVVAASRPSHYIPAVQAIAMLIAALLAAYARLVLPGARRAIQALPPALDLAWLPLHVGTAALAYGALALAGAAGLVWLLGGRQRDAKAWLMDRSIAAGYPLLTSALVFGMIWAQVAWGRYWGWDLKEVWTLVTWLVYGLYWHVRGRPRWQGQRLAWLAVAGLASVLATFLGVGWLARAVGLESLHLF
jgi:ABC-type transport system involved in cytochrome c biogenesis permease subunit